MLFIFGWGKQTVKNHGPVYMYHCDNCNNDRNWLLYSRRTWFTLFFIPVIPYNKDNAILCPVCSHGSKLDDKQFEHMKAVADCNMELINKRISDEAHAAKLKQLAADFSQSNSIQQADGMSGKTETQRNYWKQIREFEQEREAKRNAEDAVEADKPE